MATPAGPHHRIGAAMNDGTLGPCAMGAELRVVAEITDFGVHVTVGDRSAAEQVRTAAVAP